MNIANKLKLLSKNKMVLYVLYFIVALNILGYMTVNNFESIALFTLVLYVTTFFSKNMAVILIAPLIVTNFFNIGNNTIEGLKNKSKKSIKEGKTNLSEELKTLAEKEEEEEDEDEEAVFSKMNADTASKYIEPNETTINRRKSMEEQYDNLDNMLGKKNIEKMTAETSKLIEKQQSLNESMQAMGPLLKNAQGLLEGFDIDGLTGVQQAIQSLNPKKKTN